MTATIDNLNLTETLSPTDQDAVCGIVADARAAKTAVYPIGGGTSLDFGLPTKLPGVGLSLAELNRVVDYPARDMTITVDAGITMAELAATLAQEGQRLPIDVPMPSEATLGGVVATSTNGPRRYSCGTIRDHVIGISAVDGRGVRFSGGGRVVKNVAGYDFCKLLTGSLGTLGVIVQVTLKVKPAAEHSVLMACDVDDLARGEKLLAALVNSQTSPAAIELLAGPRWREQADLPGHEDSAASLVVGLEGTAAEVAWMEEQLADEWDTAGISEIRRFAGDDADRLWSQLAEFPAGAGEPLVIKAALPASRVTEFCALASAIDPNCSWQAHAGNGIVVVRFAEFAAHAVARLLIGRLQPAAALHGGSVIVLHSEGLGDLTRQAVWGRRDTAVDVMQAVRDQFDPDSILNPGRFVY